MRTKTKETIMNPKFQIGFKEVKRGWSTEHIYIVNGKEYPSVTKILGMLDSGKSGGLMGWAKKIAIDNMISALKSKINQSVVIDNVLIEWLGVEAKKEPERVRDEAADIGSQCHNAIDEYIQHKPYEHYLLTDKSKIAFQNFRQWIESNNIKFIQGDTSVVSLKHKFGGRLDALAEYKGGIALMDWKTSGGVYPSHAMQVGGYAIALKETYGINPKYAFIVRFSKDSEIIEEKEVNLKNSKKCFLNLIQLYYNNKMELLKEE